MSRIIASYPPCRASSSPLGPVGGQVHREALGLQARAAGHSPGASRPQPPAAARGIAWHGELSRRTEPLSVATADPTHHGRQEVYPNVNLHVSTRRSVGGARDCCGRCGRCGRGRQDPRGRRRAGPGAPQRRPVARRPADRQPRRAFRHRRRARRPRPAGHHLDARQPRWCPRGSRSGQRQPDVADLRKAHPAGVVLRAGQGARGARRHQRRVRRHPQRRRTSGSGTARPTRRPTHRQQRRPRRPKDMPKDLPRKLPKTPQEAADLALKAIDPTTVVSTGNSAKIAGRNAYELILSPRDTSSLVGQVRLAIDAKEHVPLRVQVLPKGSSQPAVEVGFTQVSFAPPGRRPVQLHAAGRRQGDRGHRRRTRLPARRSRCRALRASRAPGQRSDGKSTVIGKGWTAVFVARVGHGTRRPTPPSRRRRSRSSTSCPRAPTAGGC